MISSAPIPLANFRVGTIGFSYDDWDLCFYPPDTRTQDRLSAYAGAFDTVELNTTFYRTPTADQVAAWIAAVPDHLLFSLKTPRLITHDTPLSAALPLMLGFLDALAPINAAKKLGPILVQFPPTFTRQNAAVLGTFLKQLPTAFRYALEFRHDSWLHPATIELLSQHRCAWVAADYSTKLWPLHATTDFLYLRFVGQHHRYPTYEKERFDPTLQLEHWLTRLRPVLPIEVPRNAGVRPAMTPPSPPNVFAFFADDFAGHAPATANRFRRLVNQPAREPTNGKPPSPQGSLF